MQRHSKKKSQWGAMGYGGKNCQLALVRKVSTFKAVRTNEQRFLRLYEPSFFFWILTPAIVPLCHALHLVLLFLSNVSVQLSSFFKKKCTSRVRITYTYLTHRYSQIYTSRLIASLQQLLTLLFLLNNSGSMAHYWFLPVNMGPEKGLMFLLLLRWKPFALLLL